MSARERAGGALLGLATGAAAAPLVYAVVRAIEARVSPEPDPAAVIWSERSALLSRLMVVGFVTAMLAGGAVALAAARPALMPRLLAIVAVVATLAALAQAAVLP